MKTKIIFLYLFLVLFSCRERNRHRVVLENNKTEIQNIFFTIKKFVDGDTFWINDGSKKGLKIRLIGVDTPESQARFGNPEDYYGDEASAFTKSILINKKVRLEFDADRTDSFGRTLAYVYTEDGIFLNKKLVNEGYAMVMTVPPNVKYADIFVELQKKARDENLGLWNRDK